MTPPKPRLIRKLEHEAELRFLIAERHRLNSRIRFLEELLASHFPETAA